MIQSAISWWRSRFLFSAHCVSLFLSRYMKTPTFRSVPMERCLSSSPSKNGLSGWIACGCLAPTRFENTAIHPLFRDVAARAASSSAPSQLWAFDFDGVACDSCGESSLSAWKVYIRQDLRKFGPCWSIELPVFAPPCFFFASYVRLTSRLLFVAGCRVFMARAVHCAKCYISEERNNRGYAGRQTCGRDRVRCVQFVPGLKLR